MEKYTLAELISTALGAFAVLGTLFKVVGWINSKWEKRKLERDAESTRKLASHAEIRRIEIEDENATDARWATFAAHKDAEIARLEKKVERLEGELEECESSITLSRPTVTKIYQGLDLIERRMQSLRVASCPDNVAEIINERLAEVQITINEVRKNLP